jgi:hypothetical protein
VGLREAVGVPMHLVMRSTVTRIVLASLVAGAAFVAGPLAPARAAEPVTVNPGYAPAFNYDAPDPHILRVGTKYYAYTTGTTWGNHIGILRSNDPSTGWQTITGVLMGSSAFAIDYAHVPAGWQVNDTQIAPGVFRWGGRYVMYYAAQSRASHQWCLSVATASAPEGPFVDRTGSKPLLCLSALGGVTDPAPFVDVDGRAWLYFKTNTGSVVAPARLWAVPLSRDGMSFTAMPTIVLTQLTGQYPWETTIENPQMIVHNGTHYLMYSGNQWNSRDYAMSYAVCTTAHGPCSRIRATPFLMHYGKVIGPGGGTAFTDTAGRSWLAYHAWSWPCTSYSCGGKRKLYVTPLLYAGRQLACTPPAHPAGYRMVAVDGGVFSYGTLPYCGGTASERLQNPIAAIANVPGGGGYWLARADGAVYTFGNAQYYGSTGGRFTNPIVSMMPAADGRGYWLAGRDGAVLAYGAARSFGSKAGQHLNRPIVGMTARPDGSGYWLVGSDGGIFTFGAARFYGSMGGHRLNKPILGMAVTRDGKGYWLIAQDGGIFTFGSARFYGSTGNRRLNQPIVGMTPAPDDHGYWLVAKDGGIFSFGSARFYGSAGNLHLRQPVVGMS